MTLQHKTELNNATCPQEIVQIGRRRNNRGARDLRLDIGAHPGCPSPALLRASVAQACHARTAEPTLGLLPSSVEG